MEFLSFDLEGRDLVFTDDKELRLDDSLVRRRDNQFVSASICNTTDGMEFAEPDILKKSVLGNQMFKNLRHDTSDDSCRSVRTSSSITMNSVKAFGAQLSRSAQIDNEKLIPNDSNSSNKLAAPMDVNGNRVAKESLLVSALEPLVSAKRVRTTNLQSQIAVCQVLDCNKNLSSSKDYHKRHRVCEVHSKATVVIVNGIRQRFCQQCSRFHLLPEFDEDKRSCRKRLANHNERRRKPPLGTHLGSPLFRTGPRSTFLPFSNFSVGSLFCQQYNEQPSINRRMQMQEKQNQLSHTETLMNFNMEKQYHLKNYLEPVFSVPELSAESNSSSALSLLSDQFQSSVSNSSCMPISHPSAFQENQHANLCIYQKLASSFQKTNPENSIPSVYKTSNGADQDLFPLVLDTGFSSGFEAPQNNLFQEPSAVNLKFLLSPGGVNTLDLFQLSSHLDRVERQKYSTHSI